MCFHHNSVHFFDISAPKSDPSMAALRILTSKCASRRNGVHFFDMSTSKSGPTLKCFAHFDLEMCFAPHRRALLRHRSFQKWSDVGVFCTCWLGNVLRATTACNFSSLIWPRGSAPAATFRTSGATNHWKNTVFRDFPTFSRTWIFFLLRLSLFWSSSFFFLLSSFFFSSSLLLFSSLLFSALLWLFPSLLFICPCCRKFDF